MATINHAHAALPKEALDAVVFERLPDQRVQRQSLRACGP
jgi:hypothetical protein